MTDNWKPKGPGQPLEQAEPVQQAKRKESTAWFVIKTALLTVLAIVAIFMACVIVWVTAAILLGVRGG